MNMNMPVGGFSSQLELRDLNSLVFVAAGLTAGRFNYAQSIWVHAFKFAPLGICWHWCVARGWVVYLHHMSRQRHVLVVLGPSHNALSDLKPSRWLCCKPGRGLCCQASQWALQDRAFMCFLDAGRLCCPVSSAVLLLSLECRVVCGISGVNSVEWNTLMSMGTRRVLTCSTS